MDPGISSKLKQALELASRLERISVDSYWAHYASGLRVAILRIIDRSEERGWELSTADTDSLDALIEQGYRILGNAAREMGAQSNRPGVL